MTFHKKDYDNKILGADAALDGVRSGMNIAMGMAVAEPPALLEALARRVESESLTDIKLWYFHSMDHAAKSVLRPDMLGKVRPHCMFLSNVERSLMRENSEIQDRIEFVPVSFSESPKLLSEEVQLDLFITAVSPMDRHGWFTFGVSNDYSTTAARSAKRLVVEVNPDMPRILGESLLQISEVDAVVENQQALIEVQHGKPSKEDETIADIVAGLIDDGSCLQMGIGNLPNAVCSRLRDRQDLGIHTELMTPALASLVECGAVTNRRKTTYRGRNVFTFAMGDREFYSYLHDHPAMHSAPVQIVNDPRHIAKNDNVVSVNATLQIDLSGACNSEHMRGKQYSGAGGQLDFVRGANASSGGKSIIACRSTAKGGEVSRIVSKLDGPVTTPRNDVHYIVTEHGCADLRGRSLHERRAAMIKLAHPKFREELEKQH